MLTSGESIFGYDSSPWLFLFQSGRNNRPPPPLSEDLGFNSYAVKASSKMGQKSPETEDLACQEETTGCLLEVCISVTGSSGSILCDENHHLPLDLLFFSKRGRIHRQPKLRPGNYQGKVVIILSPPHFLPTSQVWVMGPFFRLWHLKVDCRDHWTGNFHP